MTQIFFKDKIMESTVQSSTNSSESIISHTTIPTLSSGTGRVLKYPLVSNDMFHTFPDTFPNFYAQSFFHIINIWGMSHAACVGAVTWGI